MQVMSLDPQLERICCSKPSPDGGDAVGIEPGSGRHAVARGVAAAQSQEEAGLPVVLLGSRQSAQSAVTLPPPHHFRNSRFSRTPKCLKSESIKVTSIIGQRA
jgi:hypothetical protein